MNSDMNAVTVVVTCKIKPELLADARQALEAVIRQVMANEPACRGIRVHEDPRLPQRWLIVEQWDSEEAFTGPHMQQPHMLAFLKTAETFLEGPADFAFWRETLAA